VVIQATYGPTGQTVTATNTFVATGTGTGLAQTHFWCRTEPATELAPWENFVDSPDSCRVSSPGRKNVRVALVNTGAAAPNQDYSLFCSRSSPVLAATQVTDDCNAELGICLANLPQGEVLADGILTTNQLPLGGGISFQSGGILRRASTSAVTAAIGANAQLEYEFPLNIPIGVANGTTFSCELRTSDGVVMDSVLPATLTVGRARFVRK